MPRFFVEKSAISEMAAVIGGEDASHISRSLRMRVGESLVICDCEGTDYDCVIEKFLDDIVLLRIKMARPNVSEPDCRVTLYQGYPKADKLELITEKAVELGAVSIVPVLMSRSVSRPDEKSAAKKSARLQRHALEAAKQSGRGIIPQVSEMISRTELINRVKQHELTIVCYEAGGEPLSGFIGSARDIAIVIGPEGGIAEEEINALVEAGAKIVTLGKRILRTETAAIAAITAVMYETGNMDK